MRVDGQGWLKPVRVDQQQALPTERRESEGRAERDRANALAEHRAGESDRAQAERVHSPRDSVERVHDGSVRPHKLRSFWPSSRSPKAIAARCTRRSRSSVPLALAIRGTAANTLAGARRRISAGAPMRSAKNVPAIVRSTASMTPEASAAAATIAPGLSPPLRVESLRGSSSTSYTRQLN